MNVQVDSADQNLEVEEAQEAQEVSDDALRQMLLLGNIDALAVLWDRYAQTLFRLLLSILASPVDAEDVLHNVFLKFTDKRIAIAHSKNIAAYVYRLTRNAGIDAFKRCKKHKQKSSSQESLSHVQADVNNAVEDKELQEKIHTALLSLPESQRCVLVLKIYDGKTFAEISEILEISANTCASRYRYATEKLRDLLKGLWP